MPPDRRPPATLALAVLAILAAARGDAAADERAARVARVFAAYDQPDSPGCVVGVIRDGVLVDARGFGMANLEHAIPLGPRTVLDIGSTSKQFSAAALVLLAQDGTLSLDDDVRRYVPELPAYPQVVTIRHLLQHTSGLRDYLTLMELAGWNDEDVSTDADAFSLIRRQRELNFEPGSERLYSNTGFFLVSVIVERVSGKSLRAFAAERIFGPLGMKDTHFHDDHTEIVPRRATGYAPRDGGGFRIAMSNYEQTGDGAVYTTVEDLLLWDRNFYDGQVGGRALVDQLAAPGRLKDGQPFAYGLGLGVDRYRGLARISHAGSWAGYRAELMRFPEQKLSVACLCNLATADPTRLATEVAEIHLGSALGPPAPATNGEDEAPAPPATHIAISAAELAAYAGRYYSEELDTTYTLQVEEGTLALAARRLNGTLVPSARDEFTLGSKVLRFERDAQGRPSGFRVDAGRIRNLRFERKEAS
jgi:CubicO group peptidase (beta-lactamase class C family)